jgi:hypothetical protein
MSSLMNYRNGGEQPYEAKNSGFVETLLDSCYQNM